jgi:hypothetical protein
VGEPVEPPVVSDQQLALAGKVAIIESPAMGLSEPVTAALPGAVRLVESLIEQFRQRADS